MDLDRQPDGSEQFRRAAAWHRYRRAACATSCAQGGLSVLHVPAMRTAIPITAQHRRNGYLSLAARA
jgi:hypothetical protein